MNPEAINRAVKKNRVLNKIVYFSSIDSTNKYLMENNFASGTVVLAQTQTAGRGKQGAPWVSGKGGLWFSFVINKKIINPYIFVVLSSVAVAETLARYGLKPVIKWPNDILVNSSKICGILIENDHFIGRIVTGIGVNLNNAAPKGLSTPVISLKKALGKKIDEGYFFISLIKSLDRYLTASAKLKKTMISKWVKNQADITGREVSFIRGKTKISGRVVKVYGDGAVRLEKKDGKSLKIKGEVFFV